MLTPIKTFAIAFLFASQVQASQCTDRPECWPDGSAMYTSLLARQQYEAADKELNIVYRRIIANLPADTADAHSRQSLVAAQRAWITWRDAECNLVGEVNGGVRMWKSAKAAVCLVEFTRKRTADLIELFETHGDD